MKRAFGYSLLIILTTLLASISTVEIVKSESAVSEKTNPSLQPIVSGEIDSVIFSSSVPRRMIIGETYTIVLFARNTGDVEADFLVQLYLPFQTLPKYFYIQPWEMNHFITLHPGESRRTEFYITTINTYRGSLLIVGNLYSLAANQTALVDSVSTTVHEIRTALPVETTISILVVIFLALFIGFAIKFLRKPESRREFIVVLMLFLGAILLRASYLSRVATYPDELSIWSVGCDILQNDWEWRKLLMWGGYPPLFFYLSAVTIYSFGSVLEAIRAVSVIFGSLTVVPVYLLGKSLFGKKVGLLSALLLLFSPYHILYSRISMTEALMLFFMTTSAYFFWTGYKKKSWKNMCVSGIFLGLSLNTKYIAAVAIVVAVLLIVWVEKSLKPLLKRNFLVWLGTILVVISPVQLMLLLKGVNPYWWYFSQAFSPKSTLPAMGARSFIDLIPRGLRLQVYLNARAASPWLPWLSAYEVAILVLFLATVLYHAYPLLRARAKETFLMLLFLLPLFFSAVNPWKGTHWLLYPLPYYFIMLSSLTVRSLSALRSSKVRSLSGAKGLGKLPQLSKVLILIFVMIFALSSVVVGVMSPVVDRGEFEGARLALLYVKNRMDQGDFISGWWWNYYIYYINVYDVNVTYVPLETVSSEVIKEAQRSERLPFFDDFILNEFVLTTLKPRFIVVSRLYLDFFFSVTMKGVLLNDYELVWSGRSPVGYFWEETETNHQLWLVFERKTEEF